MCIYMFTVPVCLRDMYKIQNNNHGNRWIVNIRRFVHANPRRSEICAADRELFE